MEVDSSSELNTPVLSPKDRVLKRLALIGVPDESLEQLQPGMIAFARRNSSRLQEIVNAILPTDDELETAIEAQSDPKVEDLLHESMVWLQWLMFDGDPVDMLQQLALMNAGQRGVCGSVWGHNDIAYRCRTCEHDPTCAICVPCFQNGNHKDHDYSIIYTGGGCCDCGDVTAWKRSGFCSKHKGAEQIQPLREDIAKTLRPVLDYVLLHWKGKLKSAESNHQKKPTPDDNATVTKKVADVLTSAVVGMLLEFCKCSESLLSFVSGRLCCEADLLDVLVRAEMFLSMEVVRKLQELLLKLLSDPFFKYEFAKAFLKYYPTVVNEAVKECKDSVFKMYLLLPTFSVQIFTVPTLTPRLVKEMDLLTMLLECLTNIFSSCSREDHRLQVSKWGNLYETTHRVVEDIRFVMSHSTIPKYMTCERRDLSRTWMKLLAFVQGVSPQKRETNIHIEEENESMHLPFVLGHSIANIHALLVAGAFSTEDESVSILNKQDIDEQDTLRHAKVGRLSQESSVSSVTARGTSLDCEPEAVEGNAESISVLTSISWLMFECLRAIENWLKSDNTSGGNLTLNLLTSRSSNASGSFGDRVVDGDYTNELEALSLADWPEIEYDVSSQEISVHIPLHRLLSLVLQRALKRCYGESESPAVSSIECGDFFGHVLGGCHPYGFSAFVMEHPLRIRVFCSEVHAGMWRKNGDAAILSYEWYRSVRWSEQGLELDLFLLQCCAALAPADLYIARIIERFGLSKYFSFHSEIANEHEEVLVHEMLTLIIEIVIERRFCGLTASQCVRSELICKLSAGNTTRSQLVHSLSRDSFKADQFKKVLDAVAEYYSPSVTEQGMYELREECWKELDLYLSCWTPKDLQAAKDRYLQFCEKPANAIQLPKWSTVYYPLNGLAKVPTCKKMLEIIRVVLFYAHSSHISKPSHIAALHLLSLALDIFSMNIHDGFSLLAFAGEEISMRSSNESLLSLLVSLMKRNEKESVNHIQNLLKKFSVLDSRCLDKLKILAPELVIQPSDSTLSGDASNSSSMSDRKAVSHEKQPAKVEKIRPDRLAFLKSRGLTGESDSDGNSCPICLDGDSKFPPYFFAVLQKSRVVSLLDKGRPSLVKEVQRSEEVQVSVSHEDLNVQTLSTSETVISSELVHKAIEKLAAFGQPQKVDAFREFIKIHAPHIERIRSPLTSHGVSSRKKEKEKEKQTTLLDNAFEESLYTQVLCVMKGDAKAKEFLTAGCSSNEYLLPAKYIASLYDKSLNKVKALSSSVTSVLVYNAFGPLDCNGIYVSSCGHAAHQKCLEKYLLGLKPRNAGGTSLSLESVKNGFPCFMCRALGNSMLPNLPREGTKDSRQFKSEVPSSLDGTDVFLLKESLSLLEASAKVSSRRNEFLKLFPAQDKQEGGTDLELISLLRGMYLSKADKILGPNRVSDSMIMWDTLKYSLIHTEIVGRSERTSSSVDALYEGLKSSNAFMLSLLLRTVNRTRVKNALDVLLRLMCIKKLAKSICSHDAPSEPPTGDTYGVEESIMKMLENADMGKRFPDIQFWAMASYPVLASDAFSTLMWILFCLPVPFMSSEKAFFSLVHLCYAVSISQAAIACYGRKRSMNDLSDDNKLIIMIFEFMDGHGGSLSQYLVSKYMENFRDIKDAIRSLSYPFL